MPTRILVLPCEDGEPNLLGVDVQAVTVTKEYGDVVKAEVSADAHTLDELADRSQRFLNTDADGRAVLVGHWAMAEPEEKAPASGHKPAASKPEPAPEPEKAEKTVTLVTTATPGTGTTSTTTTAPSAPPFQSGTGRKED